MRGVILLLNIKSSNIKLKSTTIFLHLFFIILSFISLFIFAHKGLVYNANDLKFHTDRINGIYQALKEHNSLLSFPSFKSFQNVGGMFQSFYPMITIIPFALLRFIIPNAAIALYIGLGIYTYIGFFTAYKAMLLFTKKNVAQSAYFAIIYNFSIYHMTDLFIRFDLGEWIALMFFPLAMYGFFNLLFEDGKYYYLGALSLTIIAYSHILSLVFICTVLLFFCFICLFKHLFTKEKIVKLIKMCGIFLLQTVFVFYPIINYSINNQIHFPKKFNLMHSPDGKLASLGSYIVASLNNHLSKTLGIIFLVIFILGIILWKKMPQIQRFSFGAMLLITICTTAFFPWFLFQKTPIAIIQFPWRLLGLAGVFMALVAAWIVDDLTKSYLNFANHKQANFRIGLILLLLVLPSISAELYTFYHKSHTYKVIKTTNQNVGSTKYAVSLDEYGKFFSQKKHSSKSTDYYTKLAYKHKKSIKKRIIIAQDGTRTKLPQTSYQNNILSFSYYSKKKQTIDLPIIYYKGHQYSLKINGVSTKISESKRGTLKISVTKGLNKIQITNQKSLFLDFLAVLALFTWILTLISYLKRKKSIYN